MKTHNSLTKTAATLLALVTIAVTGYGQKRWDAPRIVASYCSGCHGVDGNAQLPYVPKLAGQNATYAEKKIAAFQEPSSPPVDELYWWAAKALSAKKAAGSATRNEKINMEGVAHAAKPELLKQAAIWYANQPAAAGHSGSNKALLERGNNLFTRGIPEQKILPCMTCHGPDAQGKGFAPRLAGQNAEYIEGQLDKFRKGDRIHAPEMTMVTRDLDPEQAHAAAAYLQSK